MSGVPWIWAAGVLAVNHAGLTIAGLWPRSTLLGENMRRLPFHGNRCIALTIDDGPHPQITPRVLDLLDQAQAKASFFCVGKQVLKYPSIAQEIVRRGHRIENHSFAHRHYFSMMGIRSLHKEIDQAQKAIQGVTGYNPHYFRAPAGLRSPLLDPVLQRLDLKLVSWTRRGFDTVCHQPSTILDRLQNNMAAGDILLLHDGNSAMTPSGQPIILEVLPLLLLHLKQSGLHSVALPVSF
jgi:peptidoglycan-N-acetylglucosamine deacetylase